MLSQFLVVAIFVFEFGFLALALLLLLSPEKGSAAVRWMSGKKRFDKAMGVRSLNSGRLVLGWGWLILSLLMLTSTVRSFTHWW